MNKKKSGLDKAKDIAMQAKDWLGEHFRIVVPCAIACIVVIVACIIVATTIDKKQKEVVATPDSTEVVIPEITEDIPLEENAYEEVNQLINTYYSAIAEGNTDTIQSLRDNLDDTEKVKFLKQSEYIENYQNIICYTKKGPIENSYLAYVYHEVKFKDIDTLIPGMESHYICPDESGNLYIFTGELDEKIKQYLKELSTQDNVTNLSNMVQVKFNEAKESDEKVTQFMAELSTRLKTEVGEELAKLEANGSVSNNGVSGNSVSGNEPAVSGEAPTEEAPVEEAPVTETPKEETVKATTTVNVRSSDSETADKVGKVLSGETFIRMETKANGWSKIQFEGKEAFVKSEFLEVIDTAAPVTKETAPETTSTDVPEVSANSDKVTIRTTVNIRKSASETGEKLGVAYMGEQYKLLMKQADGWCKIDYNGKTAYVKTEYVK